MLFFKDQCFDCGFGTLGRPRLDVFAIKMVIIALTAQRTPQSRGNVGQVVPKVAQTFQNAPQRGVTSNPFSDHFHSGRTMNGVPWAPRGGPEVSFLMILVRFRLILERFSTFFHQNFISFYRWFAQFSCRNL